AKSYLDELEDKLLQKSYFHRVVIKKTLIKLQATTEKGLNSLKKKIETGRDRVRVGIYEKEFLKKMDLRRKVEASLLSTPDVSLIPAGSLMEFNLNSGKDLAMLLYDVLGFPPITTKKGNLRTSMEILEGFSKSSKRGAGVCRDIIKYKKIAKLYSTYIGPVMSWVGADRRVHTNFLIHGTTTGRLSSKKPNLQNIPSKTNIIKNMFVASPGHVLLQADFSQIELRILALFSGDDTLLEAFRRGEDMEDYHEEEHSRFSKLKDKMDYDLITGIVGTIVVEAFI
ncbi:unnamed protein product, partial [marine sediment metagenome]